jgi:hypothetical protein
MAEIKSVNRSGGNEINSLTGNQVAGRDVPPVQKSGTQNTQTQFPVGQPGEAARSTDADRAQQTQKVLTDAAAGRDASQAEAARHLTSLGGVSATDRLLGLDLRPTMTGALAPPPGNSEFLRHVSPQMRRTIMRKMLNKQRERMRRLARYLRDRRDDAENGGDGDRDRESFLEVIAEKMIEQEYNSDQNQILRATAELDKTARMLDVLDEMLAMQDYTISQIGTFTQG